MLKKLLCRKGLVGIDDAFFYCLGAMLIAAFVLTPSHRIRAAVEKCEFQGDTACQAQVDAMSTVEVDDYIQDTVDNPGIPEWDRQK